MREKIYSVQALGTFEGTLPESVSFYFKIKHNPSWHLKDHRDSEVLLLEKHRIFFKVIGNLILQLR